MTNTPAKAEALGENVDVEYDGETYSIPPTSEWDLDALEAYEDGKVLATVRSVFGDAQWSKFRQKRRTAADLTKLVEAMQTALGIQGN
jgi:hypothetical protein